MIITTGAGAYECTKAEKYSDGVHLFDDSGELIVILASPEDIRSVEGGEIVTVDKPEPTEQDDTNAMLVDHEYRLTLLELGITE